jgi:hypothetical protein
MLLGWLLIILTTIPEDVASSGPDAITAPPIVTSHPVGVSLAATAILAIVGVVL